MSASDASAAPAPLGRPLLLALGALVLAALVPRLWLAARYDFLSVDAAFYLDQTARLWREGRLPYSVFPPGWPLLVAVPYAFLDKGDPGQLLAAAQFTNAVLGALLVLLTFVLLRPHLGGWPAVAGAAVVALLPETLVLSKTALSENSYACALLGAWLLARRRLDWRAGLLFGWAYLIRPEALLPAAGLGLHHLVRARRVPWSYALGVLAPVAPYVVFLKAATGAWSLSGKSEALGLSLAAHPGWRYPLLVLHNLGAFLPRLPGLTGWPLAVLALLGAAVRPGRWLWPLAAMLPIPFVINPMVVRFWAPYLPWLLLAAGLGAAWLTERAARRVPAAAARWPVPVLAVVVAAGLGLAVADDAPHVVPDAEAFQGMKDAGTWLRGRVDAETIVAAYKPYTSFWAGCRFVKYPAGVDDAAALIAWARNQGAQYMVVNVTVVHSVVPALDPLLGSPLPPDLAGKVTLVHLEQYDQVGQTTAVYRIEPAAPTAGR